MNAPIRVLMITSEWPTPQRPKSASFIVRQVKFLRRAGVEIDVCHFMGSKNPMNYLRAWRQAQSLLSKNRYDLVHAQWGQSALLASPKKIPLVITFRGNDVEGIVGKTGRYTFLGRVQILISKLMARRADEVMVVSESLGRRLPVKRFHVVPSGLDLELFRPIPLMEARARLHLPIGKHLILFAALSVENPRKRYKLAEAAVTKLVTRFDAELVVAAGVPHDLMPYYMNACNALLLTSVHEGSPNVLKEALACNLPVVSVDVGDVRQRIAGIEGCVICADDSPDTIASGLEEVLKRNQRVAGRDSVLDLDERTLVERVIAIYSQATRNSTRASSIALNPFPSGR
jgi:teichuronic acid biosynthesis glycosyltransferase TuaC